MDWKAVLHSRLKGLRAVGHRLLLGSELLNGKTVQGKVTVRT